jgi:polyisoprenoid-binding protein YceI
MTGAAKVTRAIVTCVAVLALTAGKRVETEKYIIDAEDTYIGFSARHMMVTTVKGKFKSFSGEIDVDEKDITKSTAHIAIDAASLSTDNDRRDNHLKSDDFLNVAKFPQITFVGKRVEKQGTQLTLVGDLTIRDVTREARIPFTMTGPTRAANGRKSIGIEGELTINRFDFNLRYNRFAESVQVVGPEVRVELAVAAVTAPR